MCMKKEKKDCLYYLYTLKRLMNVHKLYKIQWVG